MRFRVSYQGGHAMKTVRWSGWFAAMLIVSLIGCEGSRDSYSRDGSIAPDRATKQMNELIDESVKDPAKASRVKSLTRDIVNEAKQSYVQRREADRRLYELNANYNATPEEFTKILDEINNAHMRSSAKILGLRFKIKEQLTPEEWRTLTEGMKKQGDRYLGESISH
jgi:chorismate mutase